MSTMRLGSLPRLDFSDLAVGKQGVLVRYQLFTCHPFEALLTAGVSV
jgi:hypothetical protein